MYESWALQDQKQTPPGNGSRGGREQKKESGWDDDQKGDNKAEAQQWGQTKNEQLDQSNWLSEVTDKKQTQNKRNQRNQPQTSFFHTPQPFVKELEREDPNTSLFPDETNQKEKQIKFGQTQTNEKEGPRRGNRNRNEEQTQPKRRGNREINNQQKVQEEAPRRGNRYRDAPTGGDFRKKKPQNQYYQPRENNYERSERGGYRGRGGRGRGGYNNNNYNNNSSGFNGSNNYRGGYRPKYDNESQGRNNSSNNYFDRQQRGNRYQKKQSNYEGYRGYNNSSNNYNNNNYNNYNRNYDRGNQFYQNQQKVVTKQPEIQKVVEKTTKKSLGQTASMVPKGRKCWPENSINILGCKIVLTARHLQDFRCKLLVVPYSTVQMEYYPGNAVNSSSVDYRKKIMSKGEAIEKPGSVYLQKAIQVYSFEALAFLKVNKQQKEQSLKIGIKELIRMAELYQKPITLESIVFAISQELGDPSSVISPFFLQLQKCRRVKQVWITSVQGECYIKAAGAFTKQIQKMFKGNEICLN